LPKETINSLRWVAVECEKADEDIEFIDENKNLKAVKV
tara:strand:- start:518 stop:631 length:114 start_codon:yes stop_codon:yes gene_type:complete